MIQCDECIAEYEKEAEEKTRKRLEKLKVLRAVTPQVVKNNSIADKVLGAAIENDILCFVIKWKNGEIGLVPSDTAFEKYPRLVSNSNDTLSEMKRRMNII